MRPPPPATHHAPSIRRRDKIPAAAWGIACLAAISATFAAATEPALLAAEETDPLPRTNARQRAPAAAGTALAAACANCHTVDPVLSHPVDVIPSMAVPRRFPLENGRMTCITCHDQSKSPHSLEPPSGNPLLRGDLSGAAFCAACHQEGAAALAARPHAAALTKAHLEWPDRSAAHDAAPPPLGLDEESRSCMSCHDGSLAMEAGGGHGADPYLGALAPEHPVGVPYGGGSARAEEETPLRHASSLDDRIRLFDGAVGCGSCHSVYAPEENLLVMSNFRSALCLSCHDD